MKKITNEFALCILTTVLGTLCGLLFNNNSYRDYAFILFGIIVITIFLFFYYKSHQQIITIDDSLGVINKTLQGKNCVYYGNSKDYYDASTKLVSDAQFEILTFNDYFRSAHPVLGKNTPVEYYQTLEDKIVQQKKNSNFKHITIYHLPTIDKSNLSGNLINHLKNVHQLKPDFKGNLRPLMITRKQYKTFLSFTIIDRKYLRITFHGISDTNHEELNTSGGIIFYENNNGIISELSKWFEFVENDSEEITENVYLA